MRNRRKWLLLLAVIAAMIFGGCQAHGDEGTPDEEGLFMLGDMKVAAYINTWGNWKAKNIRGEYLSDLILAFALINSSTYSSITMNGFTGLWEEVAELKETWPDLKVTLSVGGANEKGFPNMSADAGKRAAFISDICAWMKNRDLDGVDIDWEFPQNSAQWRNYISLLRETRNALDKLTEETGKQYSLSSAVSASYSDSMLQAAEFADTLKVMNYDYYGSWSGVTGHNANLYNNPRKQNDMSTDKSISGYLKAGVPSGKIMLGVAFYGKVWNNVSPGSYTDTPGLYQSSTAYDSEKSWVFIRNYLADSRYTRYWDDSAQAPFLYNASDKKWVSYTDPQQIQRLAAYGKEKKLGGVFAWEYSQDSDAELLQALAENVK